MLLDISAGHRRKMGLGKNGGLFSRGNDINKGLGMANYLL